MTPGPRQVPVTPGPRQVPAAARAAEGRQTTAGPGRRRIVVAITGASGAVYGVRAAEMLSGLPDVETHLIITSGGRKTLAPRVVRTDIRV